MSFPVSSRADGSSPHTATTGAACRSAVYGQEAPANRWRALTTCAPRANCATLWAAEPDSLVCAPVVKSTGLVQSITVRPASEPPGPATRSRAASRPSHAIATTTTSTARANSPAATACALAPIRSAAAAALAGSRPVSTTACPAAAQARPSATAKLPVPSIPTFIICRRPPGRPRRVKDDSLRAGPAASPARSQALSRARPGLAWPAESGSGDGRPLRSSAGDA